jgi:hypothetical protein
VPALYHAPVSEFLTHDEDFIVGRLSAVAGRALTELAAEQLEAWRQQIAILRLALKLHRSRDWHLLFEYPIPRRGKRIDAVILAEDLNLSLGVQVRQSEVRS